MAERARIPGVFLAAVPLAAALVCLGIGRYSVGVPETLQILLSPFTGHETDPAARAVILSIRLPRVLLALLTGGALAAAGASFQALFNNPLATPDTLGVATGASFGAALALLLRAGTLAVQVSAMGFGFLALLVTAALGRQEGRNPVVTLVLTGIVVSALFQALLSLTLYLANPEDTLPAVTYWLLGSMSRASPKGLALGAPFFVIGVLPLFLLRWRLNILSLQEDEAQSLGVDTGSARLAVMAAGAAATAAGISLCGQVGWVGLLAPHMARMVCGGDNRRVIPASICVGGTMTVITDTIARSATAAEIPISILTAVAGAPFFIFLLRKTGGAGL